MNQIRIISVEELSTGKILKILIEEQDYETQKAFIEKFNEWKDESDYSDYPDITEKDLSRWINGTVKKPGRKKLEMFSAFFNVPVDYLECKESRKRNIRKMNSDHTQEIIESADNPNLLESLKKESRFMALKDYCRHLGIQVSYEITKGDSVTYETEVIQEGKLYTVEVTDNSAVEAELTVQFQDGSTILITDQQLNELGSKIDSYIEFEFSKLMKSKK